MRVKAIGLHPETGVLAGVKENEALIVIEHIFVTEIHKTAQVDRIEPIGNGIVPHKGAAHGGSVEVLELSGLGRLLRSSLLILCFIPPQHALEEEISKPSE